MSEYDADEVLRTFELPSTPSGWGEQTDLIKRLKLTRLLERFPDEQIDALAKAIVEDSPLPSASPAPPPLRQSASHDQRESPFVDPAGPVFVVHGRDHTVLHHAVRVLERSTGREVIVLHEQANAGRTILEKFEHHAASAAYAVVLLTGDDEGHATGESHYRPRARQNVIFELGYFFGKLGRRRVAVLTTDVEKPSDIDGLVYIRIDDAGAWKLTLAKELEQVGIDIDYSRIR